MFVEERAHSRRPDDSFTFLYLSSVLEHNKYVAESLPCKRVASCKIYDTNLIRDRLTLDYMIISIFEFFIRSFTAIWY